MALEMDLLFAHVSYCCNAVPDTATETILLTYYCYELLTSFSIDTFFLSLCLQSETRRAMTSHHNALFTLALFVHLALSNAVISSAATLAVYNKCKEMVWPGIQPSAGRAVLARGGFQLLPNQAYTLQLPAGWSGRVWGRQGCNFDASGRGRCATGDCGGQLYCDGLGGAPPATLVEITLAQGQGSQDFYDVSLVDGYNVAMAVDPFHGTGQCGRAGCVSDLNKVCPPGLAVRGGSDNRVVACKSACSAFGSPRYCCTGSFGSPQQCGPTPYSRLFKQACPRAYSYAYDDPTSILTCTGASYVITFCAES